MLRLTMFLGFAAVIVGTFLTWSDNPPFSETGLERAAGVFALVASALAGGIALVDRRPRGAIIAVSAATLVLIATATELLNLASGAADPGAGLYLSFAGAVLATAAAAAFTFSLFKRPGVS